MKVMYYLCQLTYKQLQIDKTFDFKYFKMYQAISGGICRRCGNVVKETKCLKCQEFGLLEYGDILYQGEYVKLSAQEITHGYELILSIKQRKASEFLVRNLIEHKNCLIWAVCGAGKTEICFEAIEQCIRQGYYVGFAIPRIDVLYDVSTRLKSYFKGINIAVLNGQEEKIQDGQIYVLTTNQLLKFNQAFHLLIVDEVDAYPYFEDLKYEYAVNKALHEEGIKCYLTATITKDLNTSDLNVFIINNRFHGYELPVPILIKQNTSLLPFKFINNLTKRDRQILIFCSSINNCLKYCKTLSKLFNNYVIDYVYASDERRREKIISFSNNKIDILLTTTILERGVTFDDIDVYVLDSDERVFTKSTLIQIAGRVRRKAQYQDGNIFYVYHNLSMEMKEAIEEINLMNNGKITEKYASIKILT